MSEPLFIDNEKYISTKEAARSFDYTSDYVGQLAREGHIRSTKKGRARFVCEADLANYKKGIADSADAVKEEETVVPTTVISASELSPLSEPVFEEAPLLPPLKKEIEPTSYNFVGTRQLSSLDDLLRDAPRVYEDEVALDVPVTEFVKFQKAPSVEKSRAYTFSLTPYITTPVTMVALFVFACAPFFMKDDLVKNISREVYTKVSEDGVIALVSDSVTHAPRSLVSLWSKDRENQFSDDFDALAVSVYRTLSEGGLAELVGDSLVSVSADIVLPAQVTRSEGSFDRLAVTVFNKVSELLNNTKTFVASLFDFETEFSYVALDTRTNENVKIAPEPQAQDYPQVDTAQGLVVVPSEDPATNEAKVESIKKSFSDEVEVLPDEDGDSGIIKPVFREKSGDDYVYVLVPIQEETE